MPALVVCGKESVTSLSSRVNMKAKNTLQNVIIILTINQKYNFSLYTFQNTINPNIYISAT